MWDYLILLTVAVAGLWGGQWWLIVMGSENAKGVAVRAHPLPVGMQDTASHGAPQLAHGELRHTVSVHDVGAASSLLVSPVHRFRQRTPNNGRRNRF